MDNQISTASFSLCIPVMMLSRSQVFCLKVTSLEGVCLLMKQANQDKYDEGNLYYMVLRIMDPGTSSCYLCLSGIKVGDEIQKRRGKGSNGTGARSG